MKTTDAPRTLGLTITLFLSYLSGAYADQDLRVATWNIETISAPGTPQYAAATAVLGRIDADVVAVQEVASDTDASYLDQLALDLGYPYVAKSPGGPFGSDRAALLSAYPITWSEFASSAQLSGDPLANDLTRYLAEVVVDVGQEDWLRFIVAHLKSGSTNTDEFRRALEAYRLTQFAQDTAYQDVPVIALGDINADLGDGALSPTYFTSIPTDLPTAFVTGADIQALLASEGLRNDPFHFLGQTGLILDAVQLDGEDSTRPSSGRRLDYLVASTDLTTLGVAAQVYDCSDEGLPSSLPLAGSALDPSVCPTASDHLPVFADVVVPTANTDPSERRLYSAILPYARAVMIGDTATGFASIINGGTSTATGCHLALPGGIPASFSYQITNTANIPVGTPDSPVDIPPGASQGFVFALTPTVPLPAYEIPLRFDCANTPPALSHRGLNTFILSAKEAPQPDMIAIGATLSNDGVVRLATPEATTVFSTAAVNIGAPGNLEIVADDGGRGLPLELEVCETNATGQWLTCGTRLDRAVGTAETLYFTVIVRGAHAPIPFDPAKNRLFLRMKAEGTTVGATNVAVTTG